MNTKQIATVSFLGRLGNQMFEIATLLAYCWKHNIDYYVAEKVNIPPCNGTEPVYFDHFRKASDIKGLPDGLQTDMSAVLRDGVNHLYWWIWTEPANQSYLEIPPPTADASRTFPAPNGRNIYLNGYFQSFKYFAEYRDRILEAFDLPWLEQKGQVSIGIRRGDYLHAENIDKFPFAGEEYLKKAMDYFYERGYRKFLVTSDDKVYMHDFINKYSVIMKDTIFGFVEPEQDPIVRMSILSGCEHHIGSNSTYDLWTAWLNRNPDKICIFPKTWYGPGLGHLDTKDLVPEEWIRM